MALWPPRSRTEPRRDGGQFSVAISGGKIGVAKLGRRTLFELDGLGAQHQMRKIDIPRMGRYVRTFGHVADIAQIALVDDFPVFVLEHPIHIECRAFVDEIEKSRKGIAQGNTTAATVAHIKNPLHFLEGGFDRIKIGIMPINGVPSGRFQASFACYHCAETSFRRVMGTFARKVIGWHKRAGRHDLPWQQTRDPYRIWLSEVMLQQTRVSAVVPYYEKFLERFPDIATLAKAPLDDVMPFWAGLGYYARARNLHRGAQQIMATHGGIFPQQLDAIHALSGIGRSTAAAISAFAFGERCAILDGNVKRVIARHFCVKGDVRNKQVEAELWRIAEAQLPGSGIESYTQGLMDLGATVCSRSRPACLLCPVRKSCIALEQGRIGELPGKSERREIPHRQTRMLVIISSREVLLEKRPPTGIWGSLWSLPELAIGADILKTLHLRFGLTGRLAREMIRVDHGFTHFSLAIFPVEIAVAKLPLRAMEPGLMWVDIEDATDAAIPAPVKRILEAVKSAHPIKC